MSADPAPTALGHLRVLDLSRVLAGPWCGQILADLGAQVIKVERPDEGDDTRHWGPPFLKDADGRDTDAATYYTCANRNKQSVTVDLTRPEGQAIVRELACRSDVLIENFRAGGLARYGLDYATLKELNPRLIYCSITGFGQDGPYAGRAGYDLLVQAASGLMSITGRPDGEPGGGPMRVGVAVIDLFTGVYAATAILAAVEARHRTGRGQYIDMALLDVGMAMLANQAAGYLHTGRVPQRQGNTHPSIVPYQDFPTADGAMLLAVGNDGQFARFCEAAGVPGWSRDPRFATNAERVRHRAVLVPMIDTAEQAEQAVRACLYAPEGKRGVGAALARASGFGRRAQYLANANDEVCILLQIESVKALENLDEILKIERVDGLFIGPADLSTDMGYRGQPAHPEVRKVIRETTRKIRAAGKAPGILLGTQEHVAEAREDGAQFIAVGSDVGVFRQAVTQLAQSYRIPTAG